MIQRIQSIFFLITAILMAVTVCSPLVVVGDSTSPEGVVTFFSYGMQGSAGVVNTWGVLTFAVLGAVLPFISIFLYKKRKLQLKLGRITSLLLVLFYVTFFVYFNSLLGGEFPLGNVKYGMMLPIIALVFNILAVLNVRKDEKLIQSLNRIR